MGNSAKRLTVHPPVVTAGRTVKRYHIDQASNTIEPECEAAALTHLPGLVPVDQDQATPPASWMVLHRGADSGAYLNVYNWVWDNVVEFHAMAAGQSVLGCPDNDPTNFVLFDKPWIGCVWELATLEHERTAWAHHVLLPEIADLAGYLTDSLPNGEVRLDKASQPQDR